MAMLPFLYICKWDQLAWRYQHFRVFLRDQHLPAIRPLSLAWKFAFWEQVYYLPIVYFSVSFWFHLPRSQER